MSQKTALLILDGWGLGTDGRADAIAKANTPFVDGLMNDHPNSTLVTYGMDVGLPEGQMGNSEVGHLNIGAGRIVYQQFARINKAVEDGSLAHNQVLNNALKDASANGRAVHLFGLVSDGGVHSHINHLKALVEVIDQHKIENSYVHAFLDGRDTDPTAGHDYIQDLHDTFAGSNSNTRIASLIGRYYAMDRDERWERVRLAYDMMVKGHGTLTDDLLRSIKDSYAEEITDEFMKPHLQVVNGKPMAMIQEGDLLICFNFRTDRPREISRVLTQENMPAHGMQKLDVEYVTMTKYDESYTGVQVLFENEDLVNTMGEVLEEAGKTQVRIAETEKYPHVTFFFSGGREDAYQGEDRILIASPKVATYDLQPEMSAYEVRDAMMAKVRESAPDFICLNFANADMVGHTGVFEAGMAAAEAVDQCLSEIMPLLMEYNYQTIVIADHGNADYMINEDGSPNTAHTKNLVPCIFVSNSPDKYVIKDGKLADIAPTLLHLMGLEIPDEMTGSILIA